LPRCRVVAAQELAIGFEVQQSIGQRAQRHGDGDGLRDIQAVEVGVTKWSASPSPKAKVDGVNDAGFATITWAYEAVDAC
jgi:hypothetical protein